MTEPSTLSLSHLMMTGPLSVATTQSSDRIGDPAVKELRIVRVWDDLDAVVRDDLVLLDLDAGQGGWMIDAAVRICWERYAAGLVVGDHVTLFASPARLADRFGVALMTCPINDRTGFAIDLGTQIRSPRAYLAERINRSVHTILAQSTPEEVAAGLEGALDNVKVSVVTLSGAALIGDDVAELDMEPLRRHPGPWPFATRSELVLAWPAQRHAAILELFLIITLAAPPDHTWVDSTAMLFEVAATKIAQWSVLETLDAEVDARRRSQFLTDLLDSSEAEDQGLTRRAARLGWSLTGWHVAFHLTIRGPADAQFLTVSTRRLRTLLSNFDVDSPLVERSDGWSGWLTTTRRPTESSIHRLEKKITDLLTRLPSDLPMAAGLGVPGRDAEGLRTSLRGARTAAQLEALSATAGVGHAESLGVRQLLLEPLNGSQLHEMAQTLLAPLAHSREGRTLITTLTAYLESGASLIQAAKTLGVHRNTVTTRLRRVQGQLNLDLDDPDQRLAAQLACRVYRSD